MDTHTPSYHKKYSGIGFLVGSPRTSCRRGATHKIKSVHVENNHRNSLITFAMNIELTNTGVGCLQVELNFKVRVTHHFQGCTQLGQTLIHQSCLDSTSYHNSLAEQFQTPDQACQSNIPKLIYSFTTPLGKMIGRMLCGVQIYT